MKFAAAIVLLLVLCSCAPKKNSLKSYEEYFPPLEELSYGDGSENDSYRLGNASDETGVSETQPTGEIFSAKANVSSSGAEIRKSVCKARPAAGPKKIGKPYIIDGVTYYPLDSADGYSEDGVASWYGPGFHGKLTANGERYNQKAMTAAHKTLPLPTLVRVQNMENGREIIVRVNDRGPFSKGRIIDLTEAGAKKLGMIDKGTAKVRVSVLSEDADCYVSSGREVNLDRGSFAVQIGAFKNPDNAFRLASSFGNRSMIEKGYSDGVLWNRVWVGNFDSKTEAERAAVNYAARFPGAFVIAR